jgi:hypothetical protein
MSQRFSQNRGVILLEILLATGLLAVVTGCLLTAFQQVRRIEEELGEGMERLEASNRLIEVLRRDLLQARLILQEGGEEQRSTSLTLLMRPDPTAALDEPASRLIRYRWNSSDSSLLRVAEVPGRMAHALTLAEGDPVSFMVVGSRPGANVTAGGLGRSTSARELRVRIGIAADSSSLLQLGAGAPSREVAITLPVPIKIASNREVHL